ncbi:MAG: ATP-binding cassette domain-containing protein [Anaerolineales bacterium]|nr:ATP-binding cassette domain-containing protein [Anaerolineales bacterium]
MDPNGRYSTSLTQAKTPLLQVRDLKKYFPIRAGLLRRQVGAVRVVDGVTFELFAGETLGLIGGSGSGKTILARSILHLIKPTAGQVYFNGKDLARLDKNGMRQIRQQMQFLFHDPYLSLNPRMRVHEIVAEPLEIHRMGASESHKTRVANLLQLVGLNPYLANRFPYEFTGSVRQQVSLARALATEPALLVVDDMVAALDPVVQRRLVELLARLQQQLGLSVLYMAPDLATAHLICDRVAILYLGQIVEMAETAVLYDRPAHPYTQYLLSLLPLADPDREAKRQTITLNGDEPNPANPPQGCRFHPRCAYATDQCRRQSPELRPVGSSKRPHWAACHHAEQFLS